MRLEKRAERSGACVHHSRCFLLMHLRLVVGSGPFPPSPPFFRLTYLSVCLTLACPAFRFDLEIAQTPPGTANQDVSTILPAARTWGGG
jgi:hypothetical protein